MPTLELAPNIDRSQKESTRLPEQTYQIIDDDMERVTRQLSQLIPGFEDLNRADRLKACRESVQLGIPENHDKSIVHRYAREFAGP